MIFSQKRIEAIRRLHLEDKSEMNKSHITDEQLKTVLDIYWKIDQIPKPVPYSDYQLVTMRRALEAAFPEQQPAAFGKLVVTEEMAKQLHKDIGNSLQYPPVEALQSFVDRHSIQTIKPIAFADRMPEEGQEILYWSKCLKCWSGAWKFEGSLKDIEDTYWLPASSLPIPEPAVDAKEVAWKEYCAIVYNPDEHDFKAGYEAAQASILKSTKD